MRKPITYFDNRIAKLKATIKRLEAERRVAILHKREKELTAKEDNK